MHHRSGNPAAERGQVATGLGELVLDAFGAVREQPAGLGELDAASGPVHQGQANLTLELGQMLRDS